MANLSDPRDPGISLFPMLPVLACTLGALLLLLVAASTLGADRTVGFMAGDTAEVDSAGQTVTWVEWDGRTLTLSPSGVREALDDGRAPPTGDPPSTEDLRVLFSGSPAERELEGVVADPDRYAVVLVHPDGFRSLPALRGYLDLLGVRHVAEPVEDGVRRAPLR